jgi:hypothetical protein
MKDRGTGDYSLPSASRGAVPLGATASQLEILRYTKQHFGRSKLDLYQNIIAVGTNHDR